MKEFRGPHGIIGHSGFVGGVLAARHGFDARFGSATLQEAAGRRFGLMVCAAPHAVKWWSNQNPVEDRARVGALIDGIRRVEAERFVLISTVDVFPVVTGVDDGFDCASMPNHPYGAHRLMVEEAVLERFGGAATILRLPALFGPGLKKNALFDMMHGNQVEKIDPGASFQWYDLERLWDDVCLAVRHEVGLAVLATEPVRTMAIRDRFFPGLGLGRQSLAPVRYDVRTRHAGVFGGSGGYVMDAAGVLDRMGRFIARERGAT